MYSNAGNLAFRGAQTTCTTSIILIADGAGEDAQKVVSRAMQSARWRRRRAARAQRDA